MKKAWVRREIEAPAGVLWALLTTTDRWSDWGPSVRSADLRSSNFGTGAIGVVSTVLRFDLPFEITDFEDGERWAWKVAGVRATDHVVESLGPDRCRVGFGVPWPAAAYLAFCAIALSRLDRIARSETYGYSPVERHSGSVGPAASSSMRS